MIILKKLRNFIFYYFHLLNWILYLPLLNSAIFFFKNFKIDNIFLIVICSFNIFSLLIFSYFCTYLNISKNIDKSQKYLIMTSSKNQLIHMIITTLIVILYNFEFRFIIICYYLSFLINFILFFTDFPFRNTFLNKFYFKMMIIELNLTLYKTWKILSFEKFYYLNFFLQSFLLIKLGESFFSKIYYLFLHNNYTINSSFKNFGFFIEEIYSIAIKTNFSRENLIEFIVIWENHKKICKKNCFCKKFILNKSDFIKEIEKNNNNPLNFRKNSTNNQKSLTFKSLFSSFKNSEVDLKEKTTKIRDLYIKNKIFKETNYLLNITQFQNFMDNFWKKKLKICHKYEISADFEILAIKYLNFLLKIKKNYIKILYFISYNQFLFKKNFSNRFKIFQKNLKSKIFEIVEKEKFENSNFFFRKKKKKSKDETNITNFNIFEAFFKDEQMNEKIKKKNIEVFENLIMYWQKAQNGFNSIDHYYKETIKVTKRIKKDEYIFKKFKKFNQHNLHFLKLNSIFCSFALNNPFKAIKIEEKIKELKKKENNDSLINNLNSLKISQNEVSYLIISFLKNWGKIILYSNNLPSSFGNYSLFLKKK